MNINELDSFKLSDAVKFHPRLNSRLWGRDEHLLPEVREKLLAIAADFQETLGIRDLSVKDITISGSNAAYSYTPQSDVDLHLVVDMPEDSVYQELFNAKKYQYNDEHDIKIGGAEVEVYVQPANQPHHSQGVYSIKNNNWVSVPKRKKTDIDDSCVRSKVEDLSARIQSAVKTNSEERMERLWNKIKIMRQTGLAKNGEFGCENLTFKILRLQGFIEQLKKAKIAAHDRKLSIPESRKQFRWGFQEDAGSTWDGVSPTTCMFLNEDDDEETIVNKFIVDTADRLGIKSMPKIHIHQDPEWSEQHQTFGMYVPDSHELHINMFNRHLLDVLRTVAHELCHCRQHEVEPLGPDAGNTGSDFENEAHAVAGIIMRDFADAHPDLFDHKDISESSGYIPTKAQADDPRFKMALTVDVQPGQTGKEANKMRLATDAQGHPQLLRADGKVKLAESLAKEFELFEEQDLFEINMGSKNLRREAAKTGAIAGMEFEMIVPGMKSEDPEMEPDYDQDERCVSIDDAVRFFHDGDYNGRRDVEQLRERMQDDFTEWRDEKLRDDWGGESEDYIRDWIRNNVKDDEWNPNELTNDERNEAFDEFAANVDADPSSDYYNQAFDEYREEFQDNWDESDWLDATDLDRMSGVEQMYGMNWPYWTSMNSGEIDADQVADEFSRAVGREVRVNTRYHQSGARPDPNNQFYVVEPDGSLEGDNDGDEGLEFVSPPMPIDELLKDLNAVKEWAGRMGVYTNQSTGLHINISVPEYNKDRLDFVKLALLLGDEYVLKQFGRSSNTYARSALGKVRDRVQQRPEEAQRLLDKMKGQMGELASKAIHGGYTDKYTSINTKDGHIEFRSPGGDWLDDNFDKIENTLLRFTVAMSAALNPEAYREEYQKKLYKLLTTKSESTDENELSRILSMYLSGEADQKTAARDLAQQAKLRKKIKKEIDSGTSGKKYWWKVSNPPQSQASIEVVATSKEEAIEKALGQDGYPSWTNTQQSIVAKPLRPYEVKPFVWKVQGTDSPRQRQGIEVVASNELEAMQNARQQWNLNIGGTPEQEFFRLNGWIATPVRPAEDTTVPTLNGRPSNPDGNWFLRNTDTDEIIYRFNAVNYQDAYTVLQQWKDAHPGSENIGYGKVMGSGQDTPQTNVNPLQPTGPGPWEVANRNNNQVYYNPEFTNRGAAESEARTWLSQNGHNPNDFEVRTRQGVPQTSAQRQGGIIDIEPDIAQNFAPGSTTDLAQQRAQGGFTGAWKVMNVDTGQELYRFSGIGNSQSDANGVALQWIRRNAPDTDLVQIEVVPIMGNT